MSDKIRVLVVDDSALEREAIKSILQSDPDIEVIGEARDGVEGVKKAYALKPDVITMDLKMPVMGGLEAIEEIMENTPIPIIVVSSLDRKIVVSALSIGAMDFVAKTDSAGQIASDLIEKVKIAIKVRPIRRIKIRPVIKKEILTTPRTAATRIVVVGISTGGPQALEILLSKLPADFNAGIAIVQHISSGFVEGLVDWLKVSSRLDIRVAKAGDIMKARTVFFAPDNYNMLIDDGGRIILKEDISKSMLHVPSIDELMKSAAKSFKDNAIGILMTGMGSDGVEGMRIIRSSGGLTIAQDEKTSVIFGMNKLAIDKGYVDRIIALERIAEELVELTR
ncbi:MAG: chemotaxis-specific protein-glutamate methyltransferase CheB [Candidatus Omnitrophica bacterium]|nr:chemotaxis-specific protein-glutamate methyltransferase CheB [Candidatus Omnitrophota bacterium]